MKCVHCGAYYPYPADHNHQNLCANCTFHEKQLKIQEEILRTANKQQLVYQQPSVTRPQQPIGESVLGIVYLIGILFFGGGIWVFIESFGDTGFMGFVLSMVAGLIIVSGIVGVMGQSKQ